MEGDSLGQDRARPTVRSFDLRFEPQELFLGGRTGLPLEGSPEGARHIRHDIRRERRQHVEQDEFRPRVRRQTHRMRKGSLRQRREIRRPQDPVIPGSPRGLPIA